MIKLLNLDNKRLNIARRETMNVLEKKIILNEKINFSEKKVKIKQFLNTNGYVTFLRYCLFKKSI